MTEVGTVKRAYVFSQVAVLVFGWHEPDPNGREHGVRVEVRLRPDQGHRGSSSAAQAVVIDTPLFRADLFDLVARPPGNFLRAHYHASFEGIEPSEREWDQDLSREPFRWLAGRLSDLESIVTDAGAMASVDFDALAADAAALRDVVGEVVAAAEGVLDHVRSGG
jgi:hypothetical protein